MKGFRRSGGLSYARRLVAAAALAALVACGGGGGSRSSVAPAPVTPQPANWRLAGSLVDTVSGAPIGGAALSFAGLAPVTSGSDGRWQVEGTGPSANPGVTITSQGFLTRETIVRWEQPGRTGVRLDAIAERPPFSLGFFRQFVRNGMEEPDDLRPIRRWIRTPNFYVKITNPLTELPMSDREVSLVQQAIRAAVPQLTGGQFEAGLIETGTTARAASADYVRVTFVHEPEADYCGRALVGANPGEITLNYDRCRSSCGAFAPETLAHEVGHAMGFWHTDGPGVMHPLRTRQCGNLEFSADERYHARIAYARPNGNTDPDRDPSSFAAVETGGRVEVICRH